MSLTKKKYSEKILGAIIAILISLVSASLFLELEAGPSNNNNLSEAVRIAAAKCPGIPGGSGSGGPDYINIIIDVSLVVLFAYLVSITIRDVRRRRRRTDTTPSEEA